MGSEGWEGRCLEWWVGLMSVDGLEVIFSPVESDS